jgi:hypothetical protein
MAILSNSDYNEIVLSLAQKLNPVIIRSFEIELVGRQTLWKYVVKRGIKQRNSAL